MDIIKEGQRVITTKLGETKGMTINAKHLDVREEGKEGEIMGYVAGHGGDVWWIKHDDDTVGAYTVHEFKQL